MLAKLKQTFRDVFAIDPRSLALMRVLLGLYLLVDLVSRAFDLRAFYTDAGVFPRDEFLTPGSLHWSLHAIGGGASFEAGLFVVGALAAAALLVGWHTRLAALLCWVLAVSLQNRNGAVLISGDKVIRLILFWSLFLPLGARTSLDARRGERRSDGAPIVSVAGALLLVQVFVIYPATVYRKLESGPWRDLTMVQRVISVDGVTSPLGRLLRLVPEVLPLLAAVTLVIEVIVPLLALSSFSRGKLRTLAVIGMLFFHLGLLGTMLFLGLFPLVMTVAWSVFLPPFFWDELLPRIRTWAGRASPWLGRAADRFADWIRGFDGRSPDVSEGQSPGLLGRAATFASHVVPAAAALLIVVDTFASRGEVDEAHPPLTRAGIDLFRLDQDWMLYARVMTNRYHVYAAKLRDGSWVDLHRDGAPLDWTQPRNRPENNRWWKYWLHVADEPAVYSAALSAFLAREHDAAHPDNPVDSLDLVMLERPFGMSERSPSHRIELWHEEAALRGRGPSPSRPPPEWKIGDRVPVVVAVPSGHEAAACVSEATIGPDRCRFESADHAHPDLEPRRTLRPFAIAGAPAILASFAPGTATGARQACSFEIRATVARPRVRWSARGSWLGTRDDWFAGRLVDCSDAP